MEKDEIIAFPFRRAEIPKGDTLNAEILGVDDGSFFHLWFKESSTEDMHKEMAVQIQEAVQNGRSYMSMDKSPKPGLDCIVEYPSRRNGVHVRGKVVKTLPEPGYIRCELVDELLEVDVHRSQIFPTNIEVLSFPKFSLKCKLVDMDCFQYSPHLKDLYKECMRNEWKPESTHCTVQILDRDNPVPTVRVTTFAGKDLTDLLQQLIPRLLKPMYPEVGAPVKAKITHCDTQGYVWFRFWRDSYDWMLGAIKSRLTLYQHGHVSPTLEENPVENSTQSSWRDQYLEGPREMFIYKRETRPRSYRVQILSSYTNGTVQVRFVDSGETKTVLRSRLVPAKLVDLNLCLIPPQCLPIRFIGAACHSYNGEEAKIRQFWKYVCHSPVFIVLLGSTLPQAERYSNDRENGSQTGGVRSQDVFTGVPSGYPAETLWTPPSLESLNLSEDNLQVKECNLIPPEADILVTLKPPFGPPPNTSEPLHSLYAVYHSLQHCWLHGSIRNAFSAHVERYLANPTAENAENTSGDTKNIWEEEDDDADSTVSVSPFELPDKTFDNWVDWAVTLAETSEDATAVTSPTVVLEPSSRLSPTVGDDHFTDRVVNECARFRATEKESKDW